MAYAPHTWVNDDPTKPLSAERLAEMEAGIEDADNRLTTVESRIVAPQEITYAGTITPDAFTGSVFYCVATGDLTLAQPSNGVIGKHVTVAVQASGATRTLTLPDDSHVIIPSGEWWAGRMLYLGEPNVWLFSEGV
jgi:hypothetical protein